MTKTKAEEVEAEMKALINLPPTMENWDKLQAAIAEFGKERPLLKLLPEAFIVSATPEFLDELSESLKANRIREDESITASSPRMWG